MGVHTIKARNVNDALESGLWFLKGNGRVEQSRNGRVLVADGPVITEYLQPTERVLLSPLRDANPFFHLFEGLWMLAGANDAAGPARYAKHIETFSDDGETLWGAYGMRWRHWFGFDQIASAIIALRGDPTTRRVVISMWNGMRLARSSDKWDDTLKAKAGGADVPCNTHAYLSVKDGALDMTVCNRSNDIIWGAYGANYVHMGMLQEFVAQAAGYAVGTYYQMSNNYHMYIDRPDVQRLFSMPSDDPKTWVPRVVGDPRYTVGDPCYTRTWRKWFPVPLLDAGEDFAVWLRECEVLVARYTLDGYWAHDVNLDSRFLVTVAVPLLNAHFEYKQGNVSVAYEWLRQCLAADWRAAAEEWIDRRVAARKEKEQQALFTTNNGGVGS